MSELRVLAAICGVMFSIGVATAPALAAFAGKESKEGIAKLENSESATVFKIKSAEKKETGLEVVCKTIKGEGAVMELPGKTSGEASGDEPASTPTAGSEQLALDLKYEGCEAKKEKATIKAEKCQLEIFQEEKTEQASDSLRAAKAKEACVMTIEVGKCKVQIKASAERENEELSGLSLKNKGTMEVEVGAGSEVAGWAATATECTGLSSKAEGVWDISKAMVIKGAELKAAPVIIEGGTKRIFNFDTRPLNVAFERTIVWVIAVANTKFETFTVTNILGAAFKLKAGGNMCEGNNFPMVGESCDVIFEFTPTVSKMLYTASLRVKFKEGGQQVDETDYFVGEGQ